jgi:hypothetical protein
LNSRRPAKNRSKQSRQPAGGNLKRLAVSGGAIEDLLDVDIHLPEE